MCTAITYSHNNFYFGRNLDFENSFDEKIVITGRSFPFFLRNSKKIESHYAIIGMGIVSDNFPLYFDAVNEFGLCMAGLLFPEAAHFRKSNPCKNNIASFELIPYVLSLCKNLTEAKKLLQNANITDENFSNEYHATPLHWIISDKTGSVTVESVKDGLYLHDNPVGVLTNSPDFPSQMANLDKYIKDSLCPDEKKLPGDFSSEARFVRAAYTKLSSFSEDSEQSCVSQVFRILESVQRTRGCTRKDENKLVKTHYSSCINADKQIYYYTTHDNMGIGAVELGESDSNSDRVFIFPLEKEWRVNFQR